MVYTTNDILEILQESSIDDFDFFIEEGNDSKELSLKDKSKNAVAKGVKAGANIYMKGLNTASRSIAKTFIKEPKGNLTDSEAISEYKNKVDVAVAKIKLGTLLVSKAVLIGPLDWILTFVTSVGIGLSDDPSDKLVRDKLAELKNECNDIIKKFNEVYNDYKAEKIDKVQLKTQYSSLANQGFSILKTCLSFKKKKSEQVNESTLIEKFDKYLLTESGALVDDAMDILSIIIEKADYDQIDLHPIVTHYCEMVIA